MKPLDKRAIPGLMFHGLRKHRFATFLLLRLEEPAAFGRYIESLFSVVDEGALYLGEEEPPVHVLQLAVTRTALEKLGASKSALATFGPPFFEGIASPHRTRILGDKGASHPSHWDWGRDDDPVDILLAVYSAVSDQETHDERVDAEIERARTGGLDATQRFATMPFPPLDSDEDLREHFGFADGISQPIIDGAGQDGRLSPRERRLHLVAPGEFILGQPNAYGRITPVPRLTDSGPPFGLDGTFLVLRQLAQDVSAFWNYFDTQAGASDPRSEPDAATRLAAKAVGRWPDGSPLTTCPHAPDPAQAVRNDFGFRTSDEWGQRCPIGSHIRRSFPRESKENDAEEGLAFANTHRIVRRGRLYGQRASDPRRADGLSRGLFFVCLCASLERQFEFVQQSWIANDRFGGLQGETDPLIGPRPPGGGFFSIPGTPVRRRLVGLPHFVTVRGGAYFFLPGRTGLDQLTRMGS